MCQQFNMAKKLCFSSSNVIVSVSHMEIIFFSGFVGECFSFIISFITELLLNLKKKYLRKQQQKLFKRLLFGRKGKQSHLQKPKVGPLLGPYHIVKLLLESNENFQTAAHLTPFIC